MRAVPQHLASSSRCATPCATISLRTTLCLCAALCLCTAAAAQAKQSSAQQHSAKQVSAQLISTQQTSPSAQQPPSSATQQPAGPPPVKMGLWNSTTVTTISGLQLPPAVLDQLKSMGRPDPTAPRTINSQSCLNPEKWKEMFTAAQDRKNCTVANLHQDDHGMSGDITCQSGSGGTGNAKGHLEMTFLNPEKVHGTMHMEAVTSRQTQPIIVDMLIDSAYQGADCQGISPDTPKVIMK